MFYHCKTWALELKARTNGRMAESGGSRVGVVVGESDDGLGVGITG